MRTRKKKKSTKPRLYIHDTSRLLSKPDKVFKAFTQCMKEGDHESALEILSAGLRYLNKTRVARKYRIPRRTSYNLLQGKSVPGLDLVAKVCHALVSEGEVQYRVKQNSGRPKSMKNKARPKTTDRPRG